MALDSNALQKSVTAHLQEHGYAVTPVLLQAVQVQALVRALDAATETESDEQDPSVRRRAGVYAMRNLLDLVPEVRALAALPEIRAVIEPILGRDAFAVRGILFDKTPEANWKVPWHQDLSIAVKELVETPGYGPWSEKAGVPHVQPPMSVLENMITLRLSLDDCGEDNAPLRVIPGSHLHGRLDPASIEKLRGETAPVNCTLPAGSALLMRPLLLHASSAANTPARRRVVHIEWAAQALPNGLRWYEEG